MPARGPQQARHTSYDLSRQMAQLRAATTTRIDAELSPANVTAITGETALLVCTVLNVGDKAVGYLHYTLHWVRIPIIITQIRNWLRGN